MTTHKHAKLIKAKADNMELVLFIKVGDKWQVTGCQDNQIINIASHYEYFLCLPQHKDVCSHWLGGGEIEFNSQYSDGWGEYSPITTWSLGSVFMQGDYQLRIKPNKEKLWIAVKTDKHEHLGGCRKVRICSHAFVNKSDAEEYVDLSDSQLIEIEVEV